MSKSSTTRYEEDTSNYQPKTAEKNVVITRSSYGPRTRSSYGGGGFTSSSRYSSSSNINPAVYSQLSSTGIADFRGSREKEKRDMQDLNERLASYIEKVRWLEAKIKQYEAELEALRNRKQEDWKPIKDMYEGELNQARKVISEMSAAKGVSEARLASLQDEIRALREKLAVCETQAKDYCKKIDQQNSQLGELEGEVATLRHRTEFLEGENAKLRDTNNKLQEENRRLRQDLDAETAAHIEMEVEAQTKSEEIEFLQELLEQLQVLRSEPVTIGGQNLEAFYKGELRSAITSLNEMYEERMNVMANDMESKYTVQMNQLRSGNVRDNMEVSHAKEEVKRLRDQLSEKSARIAELEAALASVRAERDNYSAQISELTHELEKVRAESAKKTHEMHAQIEILLQQLQEMIDNKMSMELEICCYKKLLEGEENRSGLKQLVEQTIGTQGRGTSSLSDIIGQSSLSSSTGRMTVSRSSKGPTGIQSCDQSGASITLENTSSGARAKSQNLKGWKITKETNGQRTLSVDLPDFELQPGRSFTIWAKGAKSVASSSSEFIAPDFSFGSGSGVCRLFDEAGQEKATLTMKFTQ